MSSTTSNATIQYLREIFSGFGLIDKINAPNFVSAEFAEFMKKNEIKTYHFCTLPPCCESIQNRHEKNDRRHTEVEAC